MHTNVRQIGNSFGVIIPKRLLKKIGVETGDTVDLSIDKRRIIIRSTKSNVRAGWAEAAQAIAAEGDDALVWSE